MTSRWTVLVCIALVAASIAAFMTGAHFASTALIDAQRSRQLQELNEVALRRSEVAIDYGIITLDDVIKRGTPTCDDAGMQAVRLHVYLRGAVKDIRVANRDGSIVCSAFSETLEFDKGWVGRGDMLLARDQSVRLFRVEQFFGTALGVLKDVDDKNALIAILSINAYLFDIMPTELRDHSDVVLELNSGQTIALHSSHGHEGPLAHTIDFTQASDRYPLRTQIRVDDKAFEQWHRQIYLPVMALALLLGLLFGVLLASLLVRPQSPIAEIDRALAEGEFEPFLQPIFNLRTGAIVGCEVLARWIKSDGTVIPPSRFIKLAESSGRIEQMTWHLLAAALRELKAILKADKTFKVSFNAVPHHMVAPGFVDELRRVVADAKVSPRQIVIEVTEREELGDLARASAVVAELRGYGFKVAIDDVGIGHSGLSQIQRLGANIIKIDKFFIDSITLDSTAAAVVDMLVRLADELNIAVTAEGIETAEQISGLIACGVSEGQGFVVSPPLAAPAFVAFVEERLSRERARAGDAVPEARVA